MEERITAERLEQLEQLGPVVRALFRGAYPEGLTLEELRADAPEHGYLRRVLAAVEGGRP